MFEKWKEKRELEKHEQHSKMSTVAQKFVNDVLNPNSYVDACPKGHRYIPHLVEPAHEIHQCRFNFLRYGNSVLVQAKISSIWIFENRYDLGAKDLETFLRSVCCIFDRRDSDGIDTSFYNNYRWEASYYYYRGTSSVYDCWRDNENLCHPDASGYITLNISVRTR